MDIDKLKKKWKNIPSHQMVDSALEDTALQEIMGKNYDRLFLKIAIPEILISAAYGFLTTFLIVFFAFFETLGQQVLAILGIGLLITIPTISFMAFARYYQSGKPDKPVSDALQDIRKNGQAFMRTQYWLLGLNLILIADLVLLVPLIYSEHLSSSQVMVSILVMSGIIIGLSILIWRYYQKKIDQINAFTSRLG